MYDAQQDKQKEEEAGVLFLPPEAKGVPHEQFSGRRSMMVTKLLDNPGFVVDEQDVLNGFFDAPGLVIKKGDDGRPEVVRSLEPGERGPRPAFKRDTILPPAQGQPCPDGCGGHLVSINPQFARCDVCGGEFRDKSV